jgi:hypothetical protein
MKLPRFTNPDGSTFTVRPIPTKPRRKAKVKRKGKARGMVTRWAFSSMTGYGVWYMRAFGTRAEAREYHVKSEGPIVRIQVPLPAPAGKGGGT